MMDKKAISIVLLAILKVIVITSLFALITVAESSGDMLASAYPALEKATRALVAGKLDTATRGFEKISEDTKNPSFVRTLALLAMAEVELDRKDFDAAISIWKRMVEDKKLLHFHREIALRRISETKRQKKGLPIRDPNLYREQLPMLPVPGEVFYVAPSGTDNASGSKNKPFRSLEKARDAIRSLKQSGSGKLPKGGVKVVIDGGNYPWDQTLKLTKEDSGTTDRPIVYQAASDQTAVFNGGIKITNWKSITDKKLRDKLDDRIRNRVLEADLNAIGIKNLGDATALRRCPELFVNGKPQILARWPNKGFVKTGDILGEDTFKVWNRIEGCRDGKFCYIEDRPSQWLDEPDVRLYGYWFWDWFEEFQKVSSIDPDTRSFTLSKPYSRYGYRKNQRYFALNVFRELDAEGEWYLDRNTSKIYWLPPNRIDISKTEIVLSLFDQPFITMTDVEHLILQGLTIKQGRGNGIHINGGSNCLVSDCRLQQLGGDAIVVEGGQQHGIFGCTMHTLGCGGMRVTGGNRQTLTEGRHFVENCKVSDISRLKRTYAPAVRLDGCGNRIAHNLFENIPSSALRIEGNDHIIELNIIRNVVRESDDQGGLDMFGNPLYRGVVIRWNRWSDIGGGTQHGAAGVRLDDMISGIAVYGNIFERCGEVNFGGVQIHGGKENLIENNIFIDCLAGISFSRWSQNRWLESIERFLPQASKKPYANRYPDLANLKTNANVNYICRNVFARCSDTFLRDGKLQQTALNLVTDQPVDLMQISQISGSEDNVALLKSLLFEPIPVDEIGLYKSN